MKQEAEEQTRKRALLEETRRQEEYQRNFRMGFYAPESMVCGGSEQENAAYWLTFAAANKAKIFATPGMLAFCDGVIRYFAQGEKSK